MSVPPAPSRITLRTIQQWRDAGERFAMLTCYDATTARWLARAGVPALLVGDSAAQVILGHDQSIHVSMDFMVTLTAAVRRGAPDCLIMADMPFMSYQACVAEALRNAGRFLTEGMADLVKVEVAAHDVSLVRRMAQAGIPVVAHIGWRPQQARYAGIRTALVAGKTDQEVGDLVQLAINLQQAGAVMLLIEQATPRVARDIVAQVSVPVVGCGAGPDCHGHVVVIQDQIGMSERRPSFVVPTGELGPALQQAAEQWVTMVREGRYMADGGPYTRFESQNV